MASNPALQLQLTKKWLAALRSGEYTQTQQRLQRQQSFCCLGVLCMVAKEEGIPVDVDPDGALIGTTLYCQNSVLETMQLTDKVRNYVIEMNDADNKSFTEIANWIEVQLSTKNLFKEPSDE